MPINAFGGGPGSGKTYGVMEHVVLPAVAAGRFILTNIEGLKPDEIYQYVASQAPKGKIICIGHIRTCHRDEPDKDNFFPGADSLDKADPVPSPEQVRVNGGDLVIIDEATRYWPVGEKVKKNHQFFFREHRHFSNECGDTCDLVVIDPDLTQLARALRGKVEMASVTRKLKEVGSDRYMVDIFPRGRVTGRALQHRGPYSFKKEIYSLYKSYSHEKAKEQTVDKRQSILGSAFFKWVMPIAALGVLGGIYLGYSYLTSKTKKVDPVAAAPAPGQPAASLTVAPPPKKNEPEFSDKWRGMGYVAGSGAITFYMEGEEGRKRVLAAPNTFRVNQRSFEVKVGETWVTDYSGPAVGSRGSSSPLGR